MSKRDIDLLVSLLKGSTVSRKPRTRKSVTTAHSRTARKRTRKSIHGGMMQYRTFVEGSLPLMTWRELILWIGPQLGHGTLAALHPYDFRIFYYDLNGNPYYIQLTGGYLTSANFIYNTNQILPITIEYRQPNQFNWTRLYTSGVQNRSPPIPLQIINNRENQPTYPRPPNTFRRSRSVFRPRR